MKTSLITHWTHREIGSLLRSVKRYTRIVGFTKIMLGLVSLGLIATVVGMPLLHTDENGIRIVFSGMESGESLTSPQLVNPRFEGADAQGQAYTITADTATQQDMNIVTMNRPKADITLKDTKWLALMADKGIVDMSKKTLQLNGNISVFYDSGYEMRTEEVFVDIGKGSAVSKTPVQGQGPVGNLQASGFTIENKGESIYFTGPVHMTVYTHGKK